MLHSGDLCIKKFFYIFGSRVFRPLMLLCILNFFFFVNLSLFYSGLNFDYTNTNFCDFSAIEHFLCFKIIPSLLFYAYISDRYIYQLNVFIMNSIKF